MAVRTGNEVSLRVAGLWICIGLFLLRVVGQLEVALVAPDWLPPMQYWYSGLVPYPLLLPLQILLLMGMSIVAWRETALVLMQRRRSRRWHRVARYLSYAYFLAMLLRLVSQGWAGTGDLLSAGAIPVVFHWVLALFVVLLARKEAARLTVHEVRRAGRALPHAIDLQRHRAQHPAHGEVPTAITADLHAVNGSKDAKTSLEPRYARDRARRNAERFLRR